ncbi:hypothetical protein VPH35_013809 [Triticum aestivum]|uniref:Uncharacterized protein n=1 Tax=Triticum urartu TaxID=4572 RepID=A0A8R7RDD7_TRIUA
MIGDNECYECSLPLMSYKNCEVPIASRKEEESLSFPDRYECTYLPSPREIPPVESAEGVVQERCWALDMRVRYPPSVMTWVEEGIYVLGSKERTPVFRPYLFAQRTNQTPCRSPL